MALISPTRVNAPPIVAPLRGGLLSVAVIDPVWEDHFGFGISYESYLCGTGSVVPAPCLAVAPGIVFDTGPKDFTGATVGTGWPFAIYAGVECDLFGRPYTSAAAAKLAGSEEYLVSRAFYELTFLGNAFGTPVQTANTLPSTAVPADLAEIIGELEEYAALNYAGTPTLHMNRRVAAVAFAAQYLESDPLSGTVMTKQGTPVANAPGYPDGIVFITGQVNLWRAAVSTYDVDAVISNTAMTLAERLYVASTECVLAYAGVIGPAPTPATYVTP